MWQDLNIKQKSDIMSLAIRSGVTDLNTIIDLYNTSSTRNNYDLGGFLKSMKDRVSSFFNDSKEVETELTKPKEQRFTRIRENDSPTKDYSTRIENDINRRQSGRNTSPNSYYIPYILEKEIKVPGAGRVSSNTLDSIAKYATKVGVPIDEAIGLAIEETNLGAIPNFSMKANLDAYKKQNNKPMPKDEQKALERAAQNSSYMRNFGGIYPQFLINDHEYDTKGYKGSKYNYTTTIESPLEHGLTLYKLGLYNPGDKNHTTKVREAGKKAMKSKVLQDWYESSEYTKGKKFLDGGSMYSFLGQQGFSSEREENMRTTLSNIEDRLASGVSLVGDIIEEVPHPITKFVGNIMGLPDTVRDIFSDSKGDKLALVNNIAASINTPLSIFPKLMNGLDDFSTLVFNKGAYDNLPEQNNQNSKK